MWGLLFLAVVVRGEVSPYASEVMDPIVALLRERTGLSSRSFLAPLYCLFSLPTFLEAALPHALRLFDRLSSLQRAAVEWVAE